MCKDGKISFDEKYRIDTKTDRIKGAIGLIKEGMYEIDFLEGGNYGTAT